MLSESAALLVPPVTRTRPSARATETAPFGMATSPAAIHVPLATCGTSARRLTHVEPSAATSRSAATKPRRLLQGLTVEKIFMFALYDRVLASARRYWPLFAFMSAPS